MAQCDRFHRNELFFGPEGQAKLRATRCAVVGAGGLGTHVIQQLAYLGVGAIDPIEPGELTRQNRNRYIGTWQTDPIPGTHKVDPAKRLIELIDPAIQVATVKEGLISEAGFQSVRAADAVFGCVDNEGARLVLTELCAAYAKVYIDLATDIDSKSAPMIYGGRVHFGTGDSCLVCMNILDHREAGHDLDDEGTRRNRQTVYGLPLSALGQVGPSVVSINGVVASLAVTEFMLHFTGIRTARRLLYYRADLGRVTVSADVPRDGCFYCKGMWGSGSAAGVERYLLSHRSLDTTGTPSD